MPEEGFQKISFQIPKSEYQDFVVFCAHQGARFGNSFKPGQMARALVLEKAKEGAVLKKQAKKK
jgi:hypothetical protein